jgi:hypothetical protein
MCLIVKVRTTKAKQTTSLKLRVNAGKIFSGRRKSTIEDTAAKAYRVSVLRCKNMLLGTYHRVSSAFVYESPDC